MGKVRSLTVLQLLSAIYLESGQNNHLFVPDMFLSPYYFSMFFFSIINVSGYDITTSGEIYNLQHNQKISITCVLLFFSKSCFHKCHDSIETYSFMLALVMDKSKLSHLLVSLCSLLTLYKINVKDT